MHSDAHNATISEEAVQFGPTIAPLSAHYETAVRFAETVRRARLGLEAVTSDMQRLGNAAALLNRVESALRQPVRLALLGEFNCGKTTLANLLIGNAPLPTMQLSNTCIPTHIFYSDEPVVTAQLADGQAERLTTQTIHPPHDTQKVNVGLPVSELRACEIIDFPGFSDPWLAFSGIDIAAHPADIAIWCTFSTQAWKESEATAWRLLPPRIRRNAIMAVTSKDLLQDDQCAKVLGRLRKMVHEEFHDVLLISSLQARKSLDGAGQVSDFALWKQSGFEELQRAIHGVLSGVFLRKLEKAKHLTNKIAQSALQRIA